MNLEKQYFVLTCFICKAPVTGLVFYTAYAVLTPKMSGLEIVTYSCYCAANTGAGGELISPFDSSYLSQNIFFLANV